MADQDSPYIYEFLYRGRPPGSSEDAAWHVILARQVEVPGESALRTIEGQALTPAQAGAAGFPLSAIIGAINETALTNCEAARAERDAARAELAAAVQQREAAEADRKAALAVSQSLREQLALCSEPPATAPVAANA